MAAARAAFLSKDLRPPCGTPLCSIALSAPARLPGCWTPAAARGTTPAGYLAPAGGSVTMAGTDISKAILRSKAAKREKDVEFAVAPPYHLPVADGAVDLLVNCFSPGHRGVPPVLSPGALYVVPPESICGS